MVSDTHCVYDQPALRCSFCDKHERDAKYLIVQGEVGICEACVAVCNTIISDCEEAKNQALLVPREDDCIYGGEKFEIPHWVRPDNEPT